METREYRTHIGEHIATSIHTSRGVTVTCHRLKGTNEVTLEVGAVKLGIESTNALREFFDLMREELDTSTIL